MLVFKMKNVTHHTGRTLTCFSFYIRETMEEEVNQLLGDILFLQVCCFVSMYLSVYLNPNE